MAQIRLGNTCLETTRTGDGTIFLHALILVGSEVVHYQRDQNENWHKLDVVAQNCSAPPSIISSYGKVPMTDPPVSADSGQNATQIYAGSYATILQGTQVVSYFRQDFSSPFKLDQTLASTRNASAASLVSFGYPETGATASFDLEASCLVLQGKDLVHYYSVTSFVQGKFSTRWDEGEIVSTQATGAAGCTKSPYRPNMVVNHNQEALVLEGTNMVHYWMDGKSRKWARTVVVSSKATGPASIFVSGYRADVNDPGNLEALIPEGNNLVHYWRNNSSPSMPWTRTVVVSSAASGPASALIGGYGNQNFEALVQEGNTVFHYWRDNTINPPVWKKGVPVVSG